MKKMNMIFGLSTLLVASPMTVLASQTDVKSDKTCVEKCEVQKEVKSTKVIKVFGLEK